jgi:hypothetical protein
MKRLYILLLLLLPIPSLAGTGFLKGEQTSGLNKVCFYEGASGGFSKTVGAANLCPLSADDGRGASLSSPGLGNSSSQPKRSLSNTGFLSGERTSGLNKTCFYDSPRGTFTKTVGGAQLCPLSAKQ